MDSLKNKNTQYTDEIDLFELWDVLWERKKLIIATASVCTLLSVALSFIIKPVYQANVYFLPPLVEDAKAVNIEITSQGKVNGGSAGKASKEGAFDIEGLYVSFQRNFRSRSNLWDFFLQEELYKSYLEGSVDPVDIKDVFEDDFLKVLTLNLPNTKANDKSFVNASFQWESAGQAASLLNKYVQVVMDKTSQQILASQKAIINIQRGRLDEKAKALRSSAAIIQELQLRRLEEGVFLARKLGIKRGDLAVDNSVFVSSSEGKTANFDKRPAYYRGYEILEVERDAILQRKSVDPFVEGLEELLVEQDYLRTISLPDRVRTVRVAQEAEAPKDPLKPNRPLIVVFGGVLGAFLGVALVFVMNAKENRRNAKFEKEGLG